MTASATASKVKQHKMGTCSCLHGRGRHTGPWRLGSCQMASCGCAGFDEVDREDIPLRTATSKKITDEQIRAAVAANLTEQQIAEKFACSTQAVLRAKHRAQIPVKSAPPVSPEELARVTLLVDEGMPVTWAAEETGRPAQTYHDYAIHASAPDEWASAWHQIRKSPELLALHREFAPKKKPARTAA